MSIAMIIAGLIGYVPQLILLFAGRGRFVLAPHILDRSIGNAFDFFHPHIGGILFNQQTGLVYYSPLVIGATVGLFLFYKRYRMVGSILITLVFVQIYIIASWVSWDQAASYGIRMLVSSYPLLTIGISQLLVWLEKRYSLICIILLCGVFIFHQLLMIIGFKLFIQAPTTVGVELSRSGKIKLEILQWLQQQFRK
jgi:hypothetical protein